MKLNNTTFCNMFRFNENDTEKCTAIFVPNFEEKIPMVKLDLPAIN